MGGQDIGQLDDAGLTRLRRDRIGFVFQYFNLVPTLTAGENITLTSTVGTLGVAFNPNPQISNLHLIAGDPPTAGDDVVMDAATAKSYDFSVGQQVRILGGGKFAEDRSVRCLASCAGRPSAAWRACPAWKRPTMTASSSCRCPRWASAASQAIPARSSSRPVPVMSRMTARVSCPDAVVTG